MPTDAFHWPYTEYLFYETHSRLSAHLLTCCTLRYTPALPPPISPKSHRICTNLTKVVPGSQEGAVAPFAPY